MILNPRSPNTLCSNRIHSHRRGMLSARQAVRPNVQLAVHRRARYDVLGSKHRLAWLRGLTRAIADLYRVQVAATPAAPVAPRAGTPELALQMSESRHSRRLCPNEGSRPDDCPRRGLLSR